MPIPDYQSIMLPLLKEVADKQVHRYRDLIEHLYEYFQLTEDERKELLPSGTQSIFDNRFGWAKTYLKKAGLIDSPKRAYVQITDTGLDVLRQNPSKIDVEFLKQFVEFVQFYSSGTDREKDEKVADVVTDQAESTPKEILESAYQKLRKSLAREILNKVLDMPPRFFELLVVQLLVKMGYGGSLKDAGEATKQTGDEGIDGTIKEDKLGLDVIYIQAKRWKPGNVVGRPEIQKFVGALAGQGAKKGIFITTSSFTKEALEYGSRIEAKIVLIAGDRLAQLMFDYGLGVSTETIYELKTIDTDFFSED